MKRDPTRPKTAQLSDAVLLRAVLDYRANGGAFPCDALAADWPKNLIVAKARKLEQRGLIRNWTLTPAGVAVLAEKEGTAA